MDLNISNKRAIVACDLFLSLRLYLVPTWLQVRLNTCFPNVEIVPVNTPDSAEFIENATIYWGNRITSNIIQGMPELDWIHFGSVGVNRLNVKDVLQNGITITNSKGLVISSMVASALSFMTGLARGVHYNQNLRYIGKMSRKNFDQYFYNIHELFGEKCLIVGFGDVGEKLAKVCKALDMQVTAIGRSKNECEFVDDFFALEDILTVSSDADYIVNLLPLTAETEKVFTCDVFEKMKESAFFINIGRGETVDEDSLIHALKNEIIAGAGLDVFENEPISESSPLWDMKNVILSPHVAGLSNGYWERQAELFVFNLMCYLEKNNTSMKNLVNY